MRQDIEMLKVSNTNDIFKDVENVVESSRKYTY